MSKILAGDIIALGFTSEMFRKDVDSFDTFIDGAIKEQSAILEGRIGSTAYASVLSPTTAYVKRAELCLVAVELIQRRINILLGNVAGAGQPIDITHETAQKKIYRDEANNLIAMIVGGSTLDSPDFASDVLTTSHFEVPDA